MKYTVNVKAHATLDLPIEVESDNPLSAAETAEGKCHEQLKTLPGVVTIDVLKRKKVKWHAEYEQAVSTPNGEEKLDVTTTEDTPRH